MGKPRSAPQAVIPVTGIWIRNDAEGRVEVLIESCGVWYVAAETTISALQHQVVSRIVEIPGLEQARPDPISGVIVDT